MIDYSLSYAQLYLLSPTAARDDEWVIFGSTALYLRGIREADTVGDLDLLVSRRVWGELLARYEADDVGVTVETPRAGDPPFLSFGIRTPIHVFYDWTARDAEWFTARECFEHAETVDCWIDGPHGGRERWQCVALREIRKHKIESYRRNPGSDAHVKHLRDVEAINAHLRCEAEVSPSVRCEKDAEPAHSTHSFGATSWNF